MDNEREAIVIVQQSGIGNLIHTTPAIKALRELKPKARIILLTWLRSSRILEGWDVIDEIHTTDPNSFLRDLKCSYCHLLISPVGSLISQHGEAAVQGRGKVYRTTVGPVWGKHEVEYHMDLVRQMGYKGPTPDSEVHIGDNNRLKMDKLIKDLGVKGDIAVINASYLRGDHWYLKNWGNQKYTKLAELLIKEMNMTVFFVGAKCDSESAKQIIDDAVEMNCELSKLVNVCGMSNDIKDTAALIERSRIVIGNDGGLQHVAAALDVPTVTIFTFTNPIKNAPRGKNSRLVMTPCQHRISCQHGKFDKCRDNGCLDVPVNSVWQNVNEVLSGEDKAQEQ